MAGNEELAAKIEELQKQLSEKSTAVVYSRDRKLPTLSRSSNVREWVDSAKIIISTRFKSRDEQNAFIFEHLEPEIRTEVRFHYGMHTPSLEILDFLVKSFGTLDSVDELQCTFYARNQQEKESLEDYMLALMRILNQVVDKSPTFAGNKVELLKFKFADGVRDIALRRELKRLNDERPTLTSSELRHHATTFLGASSSTSNDTSATSTDAAVHSVSGQSMFVKLDEQQKQIEKLTKMVESLTTADTQAKPANRSSGRPSVRCHYCKRFGHTKADCRKLAYRQANGAAAPTQASVNYVEGNAYPKNFQSPTPGAGCWTPPTH